MLGIVDVRAASPVTVGRTLLLGAVLLALGVVVLTDRSSSHAAEKRAGGTSLPLARIDSTKIVSACALDLSVPLPEPPDTSEPEGPVVERKMGEGRASYYGRGLAGNPTASGETFDPAKLTAAHPSLPFDSRVRVTNLRNEQSVIVRVNDRGPYGGNRIIDISRRAAEKISMVAQGIARVRLELLKDEREE